MVGKRALASADDALLLRFDGSAMRPSGPGRRWRGAGLLRFMLAVGAMCLAHAGPALGQAVRLTDGSMHGGTLGRFCRISPDGTRVVFSADTPGGDVDALYSVPIAGGAVVQLHGGTVVPENYPIGPSGRPGWWGGKSLFEIAPDGQSVVYSAETGVGAVDLYRAPIAGGTPVQLASLVGDRVDTLRFYVSPDSGHVVFRLQSGGGTSGDPETIAIYSVPVAGGQSPVTLFDMPLSGSYVRGTGVSTPISPDSSHVIFANGDTLYITDIDSGPPVALASVAPRSVLGGEFTADGTRVLYRTSTPPITSYTTTTLYSVGTAGGVAVELASSFAGPSSPPKGVQSGYVATVGSSHIITADTSSGVTEFHQVAIDTGAATLMGTVTTGTERSLEQRAILHDGTGAVYLGLDDSEATSLWYIPFSDGDPLRLTEDSPRPGSFPVYSAPTFSKCLLTPDDQTLIYAVTTPDGWELYSVGTTGGASTRLDHDPAADLYVLDYELTPDGQYLIYRVGEEYTDLFGVAYRGRELYAVDVHGGAPWLLSDPLAAGDSLTDLQIGPDGTVVYWAGNDDTGYDLYSSTVPEPASLGLLAVAAMTLIRRRRRSRPAVGRTSCSTERAAHPIHAEPVQGRPGSYQIGFIP